jgi:septal ring factor EnvC (AmiA/AmiB activator)
MQKMSKEEEEDEIQKLRADIGEWEEAYERLARERDELEEDLQAVRDELKNLKESGGSAYISGIT